MAMTAEELSAIEDRHPQIFRRPVYKRFWPLLLIAGGNDPRCPKTEAEQVVQAVKKRGGVVELKIYDNEGHGFAKIENQIDAFTRIVEFLKKYAEPAKCGCNIE